MFEGKTREELDVIEVELNKAYKALGMMEENAQLLALKSGDYTSIGKYNRVDALEELTEYSYEF
jgi:hypothetical protein